MKNLTHNCVDCGKSFHKSCTKGEIFKYQAFLCLKCRNVKTFGDPIFENHVKLAKLYEKSKKRERKTNPSEKTHKQRILHIHHKGEMLVPGFSVLKRELTAEEIKDIEDMANITLTGVEKKDIPFVAVNR